MSLYLLGIDIGTSACKVALFSNDGAVAAQASAEYPVYYPSPGWAEQCPVSWWKAVCGAIKKILEESDIPTSSIAGVGIDGQSWSAIPLSKSEGVLSNTPIWMDTRASDICARLRGTIGDQAFFEVSGNPLQPSYSMPKVLWYKENLPDVYKKADTILQSNSYIAYCLTGEVTQDLSQGYGYQCFDIHTGNWNKELCTEIGLRYELLPEIVPSHQVIGKVTKNAAAECGLREGTPVVAGGLDAACGTLGAGVLNNGETQEQGGQAGGMSICMDKCIAHPKLILGYHVVPNRWLLQGGTVGGGGVLRWFEQEFGAEERMRAEEHGTNSFHELGLLAEKVPLGCEGLVFLPYMAGERSPIWNPDAKGVYYGLDYRKTRGHMVRASMEGVVYSLLHNLNTAEEAGAKVSRMRAMGGAANSHFWTQMKSDITGKPIDVPMADTATTLGAAMLAGVGVGLYDSFDDAVKKTVTIKRSHIPDNTHHKTYQETYETYIALYNHLAPLMNMGS